MEEEEIYHCKSYVKRRQEERIVMRRAKDAGDEEIFKRIDGDEVGTYIEEDPHISKCVWMEYAEESILDSF